MKAAKSICLAVLILVSSGVFSTWSETLPNCGEVVKCAQQMIELTAKLSRDNESLARRIAVLEQQSAVTNQSIKTLGEQLDGRKTLLIDKKADKEFTSAMFWTNDNPTYVKYSCPEKNVLVGIEFEMWSDGVGRHPRNIKYICRELSP
jgi:hypothetical protein